MTDLAIVDRPASPAVLDRGALPVAAVVSRVRRIQEVMTSLMKKDTHYGIIPGTEKPTLYQPGAELLCVTFRVAPEPVVEDLSSGDTIRYRVTSRGVNQETGELLGSSCGECSSDEEKYRWRKPVCDEEWAAAAEDQRREKWAKTRDGKAYKVKQVRTSPADLANTVLKMANKRALIAMTRTVLACSDIFAQDLEDLPAEIREAVVGDEAPAPLQRPQPKAAPAPAPMREPGDEPEGETHRDPSTPVLSIHGKPVTRLPLPEVHDSPRISEAQAKRYWAIGKGRGLEDDELRLWLIEATGYSHSKDIQRAHYDAIITALQAL